MLGLVTARHSRRTLWPRPCTGWPRMKHIVAAVLALQLLGCASGSSSPDGAGGQAAPGGSGGTEVTGGSGGTVVTGGSGGQCGPGDQDCHCPGAYWACVNNRTTCMCPPECTKSDQCGPDAICIFDDGNCGKDRKGYCLPPARASQWVCNDQKPTCGCDGNLYQSSCAAVAARVSPSAAATDNCAAPPLPCSDSPSTPSCYPTLLCRVQNQGGSLSGWCERFAAACAQPSCDCVAYNAQTCNCEMLPSGIVRLTCNL